YLPINFFGNNVLLERNFIDGFCLDKHDGGGLYCYGGNPGSSSFTNRVLRRNIILRGGHSQLHSVYGVYIDDNSENILVIANTIMDIMSAAFYNHNSHETTFTNNIIYGCSKGYHYGQNARPDGGSN